MSEIAVQLQTVVLVLPICFIQLSQSFQLTHASFPPKMECIGNFKKNNLHNIVVSDDLDGNIPILLFQVRCAYDISKNTGTCVAENSITIVQHFANAHP